MIVVCSEQRKREKIRAIDFNLNEMKWNEIEWNDIQANIIGP